MMKWILVLLLVTASVGVVARVSAQTVPAAADTPAVDGAVQGPSQPSVGTGGFQSQGPSSAPFGTSGLSATPRAASVSSPLAALAQTRTPPATPTPVVDTTATNDVLHPPQPLATAQCEDGWFSYNQIQEIVCAGHGGVMKWVIPPGELQGTLFERFQQAAAVAPFLGSYIPPPLPALPPLPSLTPTPVSRGVPAGCVSFSGGPCVTPCKDGTYSSSTGSGTCSDHGGVAS